MASILTDSFKGTKANQFIWKLCFKLCVKIKLNVRMSSACSANERASVDKLGSCFVKSEITEMLPGILNQLGAESLANLKKLATSVSSGGKPHFVISGY